ncbi:MULTISPECIES: helix-turn-helix domain-containing protein, partial [Spirulina sp. CCY15215]|uniref:helix-turn-helix domain-containing protein n=1 Tax=Spirulina sp. CCY15215 TaxID=2767591 RepID=UPI0032AEF880
MATRRLTFRLYPNQIQSQTLLEARRLHAYLYNACLAHRRFEWRKNRKSIDYFSQQNALPAFRECWEEYKQLNLSSLQATVKRVDLAY